MSEDRAVVTLPRAAVEYLRRLRAGLAPLPETEREEIVRETASHLLDRVGGGPESAGETVGPALAAALAELGEPEAYAARFVANYRISAALASGSPLAPVGEALRLIGSGFRAFAVGFVLLLLGSLAAGFALVAVLKPILPEQTGLFVKEGGPYALGIFDAGSRAGARELLGWWVVPICLAAAPLLALAAGWVARRFLLARRR